MVLLCRWLKECYVKDGVIKVDAAALSILLLMVGGIVNKMKD